MKFTKIISLILCVFIICSLFCSCEKDYSENYIYFNVESKPYSLDPQIASTDEELLIVRNIFEGLLRKNENGEVVNGVCESYSKSGLEYTFNLREDAVWSNETKLTANDFVFGLRRAVTPNVKAPFANRLSSIKNAKEIMSGSLDPEELGVTAVNATTLKISLCAEDSSFLDTLTTSVSMPCNEKFFKKTIGKYGLDADSIISNGSYSLKKWNPDDFGIRLYKSELYSGDFQALNGAVFISSKDDETPKDFFEKGSVDCAFVKSTDIDSVLSLGANKKSISNTVWFMTINPSLSPNLRKAFAKAFSYEIYKDKLPKGFSVAYSIYPPIVAENSGISIPKNDGYNLEEAMNIFSQEIKNLPDKQFPQTTLYYYENEAILPALRAILGHWQKNLCAFINISPAKFPEELKNELTEKISPFAFFPVTATSSSASEFLLNFGVADQDFVSANESLLADNVLIPVAYEDTNICYSNLLTNLYTDDENGYIDFAFAIKKD